MIGMDVDFVAKQERLRKAVERAKLGSLRSSAYLVREAAVDRIQLSKKVRGYFWVTSRKTGKRRRVTYYEPAPPGEPALAHVRGAWFQRRALKYYVDKTRQDAVIGFEYSKVRDIYAIHEHGLSEHGKDYDERPTMAPALRENLDKIHEDWRAAVR